MNEIPMYDKIDLIGSEQDGDNICPDFDTFINELVNEVAIANDTEKGVLKSAALNGTKSLSSKQLSVLNRVYKKFGNEECKICQQKIPLVDLGYYRENGGYCSYHAAQKEEDD